MTVIATILVNWRVWLPLLGVAVVMLVANSMLNAARESGRKAALADVASAAARAGILADRAANDVQACYAAGRTWNREAGRCAP